MSIGINFCHKVRFGDHDNAQPIYTTFLDGSHLNQLALSVNFEAELLCLLDVGKVSEMINQILSCASSQRVLTICDFESLCLLIAFALYKWLFRCGTANQITGRVNQNHLTGRANGQSSKKITNQAENEINCYNTLKLSEFVFNRRRERDAEDTIREGIHFAPRWMASLYCCHIPRPLTREKGFRMN